MYEAVGGGHQRVPQTHVPAVTKPHVNMSRGPLHGRGRGGGATCVPVVRGEAGGGDEGGGADEDEVVSRLVVALQRLETVRSRAEGEMGGEGTLEEKEDNIWHISGRRSYQIGFGSVPTGVGLPETQTPIGIDDTELHSKHTSEDDEGPIPQKTPSTTAWVLFTNY